VRRLGGGVKPKSASERWKKNKDTKDEANGNEKVRYMTDPS